MSEATTLADPKAEWIGRVLGVTVPSPVAAGLSEDEVRARLNELGIALRDKKDLPGFAPIADLFRQAVARLKEGDIEATNRLLDQVADALEAQRTAARGAKPTAAKPGDGVSLRAAAMASLEWRKVCASARQQIPALKDAVVAELAADDEFDPWDLEEIRVQLDRLDEITAEINDGLSDMVDDLINAPAEKRPVLVSEIAAAIDGHQAFIKSNEVVQALADNGVMAIDIAGPSLAALAALRKALPA
jgi:hypothetical protein